MQRPTAAAGTFVDDFGHGLPIKNKNYKYYKKGVERYADYESCSG